MFRLLPDVVSDPLAADLDALLAPVERPRRTRTRSKRAAFHEDNTVTRLFED